jgi:hypothetical protein
MVAGAGSSGCAEGDRRDRGRDRHAGAAEELCWLLAYEPSSTSTMAEAQRCADRVAWPDMLAELALSTAQFACWRGEPDKAHEPLANRRLPPRQNPGSVRLPRRGPRGKRQHARRAPDRSRPSVSRITEETRPVPGSGGLAWAGRDHTRFVNFARPQTAEQGQPDAPGNRRDRRSRRWRAGGVGFS